MALYIPHSIFHLAWLLYVRPETFGPYYVQYTDGRIKWTSRIFRSNYLLKHVIGGKVEVRIEVTRGRGRKRKQTLVDHKEKRILEIERSSTRSHSVGNSILKHYVPNGRLQND